MAKTTYLKQFDEICDWCGKGSKDHLMVEDHVEQTDWCYDEAVIKKDMISLDGIDYTDKVEELKSKGEIQSF